MSKSKSVTRALNSNEDLVERQKVRHIRHEKKEHDILEDIDEDVIGRFTSSMMRSLTDD